MVKYSMLDKDVTYSRRFWTRNRHLEGLPAAMASNIESSIPHAFIGIFVDPKGPQEVDKEKMSAYRVAAELMGYRIGSFTFHPNSGNVTAPITFVEHTSYDPMDFVDI